MMEIKIGEQIQFLRKQKGMTQEELAQALGVTNQSVSKWESGICCPDIQLLPDIAAYFSVTIDELMGYKPVNSFGDVYLKVKDLFKASPKEESLSLAFRLATLLHEGAMSRGYKGFLHWDDSKEFGLKTEPVKWGISILNEPEGTAMHVNNGIFFTDQKYWQNVSSADIRAVYSMLDNLCDLNTLKVLFAVFEMSVKDFNLFIPLEEIIGKSRLSEENVLAALDRLPVNVKSTDDGRTLYRLEGSYMHIPSLLRMLAPVLQ